MPSELSRYVAESKNTITMWVRIADERGFDALHTRRQPGRPTKLSREQLDELERILKEDEPETHGYRVWDGPSVSSLVSKRYGVSLSARQCQRMFHGFGMSLVRPQAYPSMGEGNSQECEDFKKLRNRQESGNYEIVYQDEVHFQLNTTIAAKWVRKGLQAPCQIRTGKEESLLQRICPAIDRRTGRHKAPLVQFRDRDGIIQEFLARFREC